MEGTGKRGWVHQVDGKEHMIHLSISFLSVFMSREGELDVIKGVARSLLTILKVARGLNNVALLPQSAWYYNLY